MRMPPPARAPSRRLPAHEENLTSHFETSHFETQSHFEKTCLILRPANPVPIDAQNLGTPANRVPIPIFKILSVGFFGMRFALKRFWHAVCSRLANPVPKHHCSKSRANWQSPKILFLFQSACCLQARRIPIKLTTKNYFRNSQNFTRFAIDKIQKPAFELLRKNQISKGRKVPH